MNNDIQYKSATPVKLNKVLMLITKYNSCTKKVNYYSKEHNSQYLAG